MYCSNNKSVGLSIECQIYDTLFFTALRIISQYCINNPIVTRIVMKYVLLARLIIMITNVIRPRIKLFIFIAIKYIHLNK